MLHRSLRRNSAAANFLLLWCLPFWLCSATADEPKVNPAKKPAAGTPAVPQPAPDDPAAPQPVLKPLKPLPELLQKEVAGRTALNPEGTVFLDAAGNRLLLRAEVACPDCILEMALVPEGNREHETILRIRSKAFVIHAGLLALGLQPGKPASFSPEFKAPSGPVIEVTAVWLNERGERQQRPLQEWIRNNTHRYHAAAMQGPHQTSNCLTKRCGGINSTRRFSGTARCRTKIVMTCSANGTTNLIERQFADFTKPGNHGQCRRNSCLPAVLCFAMKKQGASTIRPRAVT